ncbi:MAG: IS5/IS1182 family transposase, partial [Thermodesulfobacteriota bacterium]
EYYSLKPLAFRFTLPSVTKITSLGVVLIGIAISLGFRDKGSLQRLVEW